MADDVKIGRDGRTLVQNLGDGRKVSMTLTPAAEHIGGVTRPVDPAAFGVAGVKGSTVGGGKERLTVKTTDGKATDYTGNRGGHADAVDHDGGTSKPKK